MPVREDSQLNDVYDLIRRHKLSEKDFDFNFEPHPKDVGAGHTDDGILKVAYRGNFVKSYPYIHGQDWTVPFMADLKGGVYH